MLSLSLRVYGGMECHTIPAYGMAARAAVSVGTSTAHTAQWCSRSCACRSERLGQLPRAHSEIIPLPALSPLSPCSRRHRRHAYPRVLTPRCSSLLLAAPRCSSLFLAAPRCSSLLLALASAQALSHSSSPLPPLLVRFSLLTPCTLTHPSPALRAGLRGLSSAAAAQLPARPRGRLCTLLGGGGCAQLSSTTPTRAYEKGTNL